MFKFFIRRILLIIPLLFTVALFSFFLVELMPGSAAFYILGEGATPDAVAEVEADLGLDRPVLVRFTDWLGSAIQGDLGTGWKLQDSVSKLYRTRSGATASIAAGALLIGVTLGIGFGVLQGLYVGSVLDRLITMITSGLLAVPGFWLATLLVVWFSINRDFFPALGYEPISNGIGPWLAHIALPSIALAIPSAAVVSRQTRSSMTTVLQSKYVQSLRANGIPRRQIVWRHVLRNAMIPVLTVIGFQISSIIGQSFIIDIVFKTGGIGALLAQAVINQDMPIVQGGLLIVGMVVTITNLLVDVGYAFLNPKVRLS